MQAPELNHNQRYLLEEFVEDYHAREMSRRDLLRRAVSVTGSVGLAAAALIALGCGGEDAEPGATATRAAPTEPAALPTAATGPTVSPTDAAIQAGDVRFPGPGYEYLAYMARPAGSGTFPGVMVIHENQGLLEHFKDVARRFAKEGFAAMAIDLASRIGGSQPDPVANMAVTRASNEELLGDLQANVNYIKSQSFVRQGGIGVIGFCFGGNATWEIAINSPDIKAAAPFYGSIRQPERLNETKAAILAVYGANDTRITSQNTVVRDNLTAAGKTFDIKIYDGAGHAFFNETRSSYHEASAKDAWQQTLNWMRRYVTA